ncbi:MAG: TIGR03960 family B12-binding radical SAM protein [candidate division WOR-3 bacterium]|nr:TIGR03960 family B12-binding radical SAM protein [candidate division WOR-3 bacterium]
MDKRLEKILPLVQKPIRYTGGEINICLKKPDKDTISVCLIMPEVYEIGMSNYGLKILYTILNRQENVMCERAYAPWRDLGFYLKVNRIPLYSLESKRLLREFNILGFSLQSELSYPNVLYILDLSGIPLLARDRSKDDPLVIAGGPCATNPLPVKDFFDAFVIGDGEEVILEIVNAFRDWDRKSRDKLLFTLAQISGVYVPLVHNEDQDIIKKRTIKTLKEEDFPYPPIVPIGEIVHDRLTVEISRGCIQGCRFCQAGIINRPYRFRPITEILRLSNKGLRATGWEEISLLALSVSDYPDLDKLLQILVKELAPQKIAISLPSMRGEDFSLEMAECLQSIKKTGLTFAPETSSSRLKSVINKHISEDKISKSIENALKLGWRHIKLYFMIGLPSENERDLEELIYFVRYLAKISPKLNIKLSISFFIPKPHTPLQWCEFNNPKELNEKINFILYHLRLKNITIKWDNPEFSLIQAVLARGDTKLMPVLLEVYEKGAIFQDWTEEFNYSLWQQAFKNNEIDITQYINSKELTKRLPWDFVDIGVSKQFLKTEYERALRNQITYNCSTLCSNCGISDCEMIKACSQNVQNLEMSSVFRLNREDLIVKQTGSMINFKIRVKYQVDENFRYAGHLDRVRAIYRTLRKSGLPIAYSQGFSPHPVVAFSPPLPVGLTSSGEYMDIQFLRTDNNIFKELRNIMPEGLRVVDARLIMPKTPPLSKICNLALYQITEIPWISELTQNYLEYRKHNIPGIYKLELQDHRLFLYLTISAGIRLFNVLSVLFEKSESEVKVLNIKRIDFFYLNNKAELVEIFSVL